MAFFFGLVAALNYVIFLVEFTDGSTVTDELRHSRTQLEPIDNKTAKTQRRMRELQQRLDALDAQAPVESPQTPSTDHATSPDVGAPATRPTSVTPPQRPGRPSAGDDSGERASVIDLDASKRDGSSRLGQTDGRPASMSSDDLRSGSGGENGPAPAAR